MKNNKLYSILSPVQKKPQPLLTLPQYIPKTKVITMRLYKYKKFNFKVL